MQQRIALAMVVQSIEQFCAHVRRGLAKATFTQRRALVELLIDRVIVTKEEVEIRYAVPTTPEGPHRPFCQLRTDYLHRLPLRQIVGHCAPLTAGTEDVEDRIENAAQRILVGPAHRAWRGQEGFDPVPFFVGQIAGTGHMFHAPYLPTISFFRQFLTRLLYRTPLATAHPTKVSTCDLVYGTTSNGIEPPSLLDFMHPRHYSFSAVSTSTTFVNSSSFTFPPELLLIS